MNNFKYILAGSILFLASCEWQTPITVVKNNTSDTLLIGMRAKQFMNDSILYNRKFTDYEIDPHSVSAITLPNLTPKNAPDSDIVYLYFFKNDSLSKYQKLRHREGLVQKSLFKNVTIQINKVKDEPDTIFINDAKISNK